MSKKKRAMSDIKSRCSFADKIVLCETTQFNLWVFNAVSLSIFIKISSLIVYLFFTITELIAFLYFEEQTSLYNGYRIPLCAGCSAWLLFRF